MSLVILDLFSSVSFDTVDVAIIFISQMTPLTIGLLLFTETMLRLLTLGMFGWGYLRCCLARYGVHVTSECVSFARMQAFYGPLL